MGGSGVDVRKADHIGPAARRKIPEDARRKASPIRVHYGGSGTSEMGEIAPNL